MLILYNYYISRFFWINLNTKLEVVLFVLFLLVSVQIFESLLLCCSSFLLSVMEDNSAEEHHYYYPLPVSAPKVDPNLSDADKGGTCAEENNLHNKPSTSQGNSGINKYALGGAILASTNSILLGYGEFHKIMLKEYALI